MRQRRDTSPHVPFIVTGLAFSLLGGFTLAISMPVEALFGLGARSWVAHAQAHGHLQVVGLNAVAATQGGMGAGDADIGGRSVDGDHASAERLSLAGNPDYTKDWSFDRKTGEPRDFTMFARAEGRFARQFAADGTPSKLIEDSKAERLQYWHLLQDLAGIQREG